MRSLLRSTLHGTGIASATSATGLPSRPSKSCRVRTPLHTLSIWDYALFACPSVVSHLLTPPRYTPSQVYEAIKAPAWTWDFISNDPYNYACINEDVPADSLAAFVNSQINPAFNWKDAEWLLGEWNGPSAIKGVVRPDDAKMAVETGFTTMWVSNHGARQLDTSPATIDVLPSIREAVGPNVSLLGVKD